MTDAQLVSRRFGLGDAMIVIAGLAPTFIIGTFLVLTLIGYWRSSGSYSIAFQTKSGRHGSVAGIPALGIVTSAMSEYLVAVWFLAYAAMRLRRPRPSLRVVAMQPGMVAFLALVVSFLADLLNRQFGGRSSNGLAMVLVSCMPVPVAWGVLLLTKRWRPEPSWIDRFGRLLDVLSWALSWTWAVLMVLTGLTA